MRISGLIKHLASLKKKHGDLLIGVEVTKGPVGVGKMDISVEENDDFDGKVVVITYPEGYER